MKPLPDCVLKVLASLPEGQPQKIVLNMDGQGHWDIEVFSRYQLYDEDHQLRPLRPLREKAVRIPFKKKG